MRLDRRHPLRSRAFAAALVTAVIATLVVVGVLDLDDAEQWQAVATLWVSALSMGGVIVATTEPVVTPTADPRDDDGTPLVPQQLRR